VGPLHFTRSLFADPAPLVTTRGAPARLVPTLLFFASLGPLAGFVAYGLLGRYEPGVELLGAAVPGSWARAPLHAAVAAALRLVLGLAAWALLTLLLRLGRRPDGGEAGRVALLALAPLFVAEVLELLVSVPIVAGLRWIGSAAGFAFGLWLGARAARARLGFGDGATAAVAGAVLLCLLAVTLAYWLGFTVLLARLL
jgi:hypothetical protein